MTLAEFRRQVLFACLSNTQLATQCKNEKFPDALTEAIIAADDTVEYMLESGLIEKYGIDVFEDFESKLERLENLIELCEDEYGDDHYGRALLEQLKNISKNRQ